MATTTPKLVIVLVVFMLGLIALAVVIGEIVLLALGKPLLPDLVVGIGVACAAGLTGLLAGTRTTPELPAGTTLQMGGTTLTNAAVTPELAQGYATEPVRSAGAPPAAA